MTTRRLTSLALTSALLLAACGGDKGTTDATASSTADATGTSDATAGSSSPTTTPTGGDTGSDRLLCVDHCVDDGDCTKDGQSLGFVCSDTRCTVDPCTDDLACTIRYSGWVTECAAQADCPGQVCIDIGGGVGRCATAPGISIQCMAPLRETQLPPIEGGADLTVCANTSSVCEVDSGRCVAGPCKSDSDCVPALSPVCDVDSGVCGCKSDADCAGTGLAGFNHCVEGHCGCTSDTDCADSLGGTRCTAFGACGCASDAECTSPGHVNADTCVDGICSCSSDAACKQPQFDGTTQKCEPT